MQRPGNSIDQFFEDLRKDDPNQAENTPGPTPMARSINRFFEDARNDPSIQTETKLREAEGTNPDDYARSTRIAEDTGLPADVVDRNPEAAERLTQKPGSVTINLQERAPRTHTWLGEGDNARLAHDDAENLALVENITQQGSDALASIASETSQSGVQAGGVVDTALSGVEAVADIAADFIEQLDIGIDQRRMLELGYKAFAQGGLSEEEEAQLQALEESVQRPTGRWWTGSAARMAPGMLATGYEGLKGALAGASAGAVVGALGGPAAPVTSPVGAAAGAKVGGTAAAAYDMFQMGLGEAYLELRSFRDENGQPLEPEVLTAATILIGSGVGLLDTAVLPVAVRNIPGIDTVRSMLTQDGIREALRSPTVRAALKRGAFAYAGNVAVETLTEAAQELLLVVGGEMAKAASEGEFAEVSPEEGTARVAQAAEEAFKATAVLAGAGQTVNLTTDLRNVSRAQQNQRVIEALGEAAGASKLKERLPKRFREFVEQARNGGAIEEVGIASREFTEYFQEKNVDPVAVVEQLGVSAEEYSTALATDSDIVVKVENLATELAGTEHYVPLSQHMRLDPADMTLNEAELYEANGMAEDIERAAARLDTLAADPVTRVEDLEVIRQEVTSQLAEAGIEPRNARYYADLTTSRYAARAERTGRTPLQLWRQDNLQVQGEQPTLQARELDEVAVLIDQARAGEIPSAEEITGPSLGQFLVDLEAQSPQELTDLAIQEGYLPEGSQPEDLQASLAEEEAGRPVTSPSRANPQAAARAQAIQDLTEFLDREGVSLEETSTEEIRDLINQRMAGEDDRTLFQETFREPPTVEMVATTVEDDTVEPQSQPEYKLSKKERDRVATIRREVPGFNRVARYLQPDELALLTKVTAQNLVTLYEQLPSATEMAAVAQSGSAKRGWYRFSEQALREIYGEDAPRFVALLAALSPQTSVESNLINTLNVWNAWIEAGRPVDTDQIVSIMGDAVQGEKGKDSVLGAWINNSVRALTSEDPTTDPLSGPKVNSFRLNLIGQFNEATNDAWMANYANVDQTLFAKRGNILPGKGAGYLAMSAKTRAAAQAASRRTGETWTPAEIQETVWSWAKALYEKAQGLDRTALDLLQEGDLTHFEINSVPDFSQLLRVEPYKTLVEAGGYSTDVLTPHAPTLPATEVYAPELARDLNRAARRLDALARERSAEAYREDILVTLSAMTNTIPGLDLLNKQVQDGDATAAKALQDIAGDALDYLTQNIKSADIEYTPATGLYGGAVEPSLGVAITFAGRDRERTLAALAKFASNFNQEQVHVRGTPENQRVGHVYEDGSYNTDVVDFVLKEPLNRQQIEEVIEASGLFGLTSTEDTLTAYFVGDVTDERQVAEFREAVGRADKRLGDRVERVDRSTARLWAYGEGEGATTGYDTIARRLLPSRSDEANKTAQRVASRLAGRVVQPARQAGLITVEQFELQEAIAEAYEAMRVNALDDPNVRRAYEELSAEVLLQYDAMPIKVEIWDGKGEPYSSKGRVASSEMRRDVSLNNHLYIYGTDVGTFGPEGVTYDNHPLLEDSGRTDINGKPLLFNDLLRAVHDYYAHTMTVAGFGPRGEEAAWATHMAMTNSPWARWALTSETRGQNSWVNFRKEVQNLPLSQRPFAEQKVDLLPLEYIMVGDQQIDANLAELPGAEGLVTQTFEQRTGPGGGVVAGSFTPQGAPGEPSIMRITTASDLSTFLHESGHMFLEQMAQDAAELQDNEGIQRDAQTLAKWLGADDLSGLTREQHEQFARGFEAYLREGKAPSVELQSAFDRFAAWLARIYRSIRQLDVELNDDIRQVMDRMIATDREIEAVEGLYEMDAFFASAQEAGMTKKQFQSYLRAVDRSRGEARRNMMNRQMRALEREQAEWWREEEEQLRNEIREELGNDPAYRAIFLFGNGTDTAGNAIEGPLAEVRLDRQATAEILGSEAALRQLPRKRRNVYAAKNYKGETVSPDDVAQFFGFNSGSEMLQEMIARPDFEGYVRSEAERRMRERHGDPLTRPTEAALAATHSDRRGDVLARELRALSEGRQQLKPSFVRAWAQRRAQQMTLEELRPQKFLAAERRAAVKAGRALGRGDRVEAMQAKSDQLLNHYLAQEAFRVRDEVEKGNRYLGKFQNTRKTFPAIDPAYLERMRTLVNAYQIGPRLSERKRMRLEMETLAAWVGALEGDPQARERYVQIVREANEVRRQLGQDTIDPELQLADDNGAQLVIPRQILVADERTHYRDLKLADYRALVDAVRNLEHLGRSKKKWTLGEEKRQFDEVAAVLVTQIESVTEKPRVEPVEVGTWDFIGRGTRSFWALLRKMEALTKQLDGFQDGGPVWETLYKPLNDAADAEGVMVDDATRALAEIFGTYTRKELMQLTRNKVHYPELGDSFSKAAILSMALNWGNEGNRQALMDGYGWTREDIESVFDDAMEKRDWDFVQSVWDYVDSYWGEIAALERRTAGVAPDKVERSTVITPYGNYEGGYYPLVYDRRRDERSRRDEEADRAKQLFGGAYARAATRHGHTINRVGSGGRPVALNLDVISQHLTSVIHDLTHREAVVQVDRMLRRSDVTRAIKEATNTETYRSMEDWIKFIAAGDQMPISVLDQFMRYVRGGVSIASMGLKLTTAIVQFTGYTQSIVRLSRNGQFGEYWAMRGLMNYLRDPYGHFKKNTWVFDKSAYMTKRANTLDREIRDFSTEALAGESVMFKAINSMINQADKATKGSLPHWMAAPKMIGAWFYLIQTLDNIVATSTWMAGYEQGLSLFDGDDRKAIAHADSIVRESQSSALPKDLSGVQRGSETMKLFTAFYSYFNATYNLTVDEFKRQGLPWKNPKNLPRFAMNMAWLTFIPAVMSEMILGRGPDEDDDEEWAPWAASVTGSFVTAMFPVIREVVEPIFSDYPPSAPAGIAALMDIAESLEGLATGEFDRRSVQRKTVRGIGVMLHLPTGQAWQMWDGWQRAADNEDLTPFDILVSAPPKQ